MSEWQSTKAENDRLRLDNAHLRIQRLEYALALLAKHVGATGWNRPLQEVLDSIEAELDDMHPESST